MLLPFQFKNRMIFQTKIISLKPIDLRSLKYRIQKKYIEYGCDQKRAFSSNSIKTCNGGHKTVKDNTAKEIPQETSKFHRAVMSDHKTVSELHYIMKGLFESLFFCVFFLLCRPKECRRQHGKQRREQTGTDMMTQEMSAD